MKPIVVVFGAGVAGLTAAQELVQRGFDVHVVDAKSQVGGRAASQLSSATLNPPVANELGITSATLPGEHGFRFFPRFYQHLTDTMARIPLWDRNTTAAGPDADQRSVTAADNLVGARVATLGFDGAPELLTIERSAPRSITSVLKLLRALLKDGHFTLRDVAQFELKVFELMTACEERRLAEYENVSWWDFVHGVGSSAGPLTYTPAFDRYIETGPKLLVAMSAREGAAKAQGEVLIQILLDQASLGPTTDRVMNGPTNRQWLKPWRALLEREHVHFHVATLAGLDLVAGSVTPTFVGPPPTTLPAPADVSYYVLAVAMENAQTILFGGGTPSALILQDDLQNPDAPLSALANLSTATSWMNGLQYYLRDNVEIADGHIGLPDSPWGLSLISQAQYWGPDFAQRFGLGAIRTILSVDVGNFEVPGYNGIAAKDCNKREFVQEIWNQLAKGIRTSRVALPAWTLPAQPPSILVAWHIDDNLDWSPLPVTNTTPMFINRPGSWPSRPGPLAGGYRIHARKLVLAGEYTQTHTGLPCMESANESARHAVNAILEHVEQNGPPAQRRPHERCAIWPLDTREPEDMGVLKELDRKLFARGVPHFSQVLEWQKLLRVIPEELPSNEPAVDALALLIEGIYPLLSLI